MQGDRAAGLLRRLSLGGTALRVSKPATRRCAIPANSVHSRSHHRSRRQFRQRRLTGCLPIRLPSNGHHLSRARPVVRTPSHQARPAPSVRRPQWASVSSLDTSTASTRRCPKLSARQYAIVSLIALGKHTSSDVTRRPRLLYMQTLPETVSLRNSSLRTFGRSRHMHAILPPFPMTPSIGGAPSAIETASSPRLRRSLRFETP